MKIYLALIFTERYWSWTLVGIVYLASGIVIRNFFFGRIVAEAKNLDPTLFSFAKRAYLKRCAAGWILFAFGLVILVVGWIALGMVLKRRLLLFAFTLAVPTLFLFSLVSHLSTFSRAFLVTLRQRLGIEREF